VEKSRKTSSAGQTPRKLRAHPGKRRDSPYSLSCERRSNLLKTELQTGEPVLINYRQSGTD
jgi:hypothetical protein